MNIIFESVKIGKVSTKTCFAETVPASYTLPLQKVPDPWKDDLFCVKYVNWKRSYFVFNM